MNAPRSQRSQPPLRPTRRFPRVNAAGFLRGRHRPADRAKSRRCSRIAKSRAAKAPSRSRRKPSSRRPRSACRPASRACRSSRTCRCRRRPRFVKARGDAEEDHPQKTRLSLLQRLANVGLGRRDEKPSRRSRRGVRARQWHRCRRCPSANRFARLLSKSRPTNRYRNMQSGRRRKAWTSMAALHLLRPRHRATTILIYRPSCAVRRTEFWLQIRKREKVRLNQPGLFLLPRCVAATRNQAIDIK